MIMEHQEDRAPATYNMKAVVRETGLKPDTLRAWERRYGLPDPSRTQGGHRLYTQRDIETLKWLIARQEEGLSISRAVDLWHSLGSEGKDPLRAIPSTSPPAVSPMAGGNLDALRREWSSACKQFNESMANQILTRSFAFYPPDIVFIEVLMKGLAEIGEEWYQAETTIQQEHFASELAVRRLESALAASPPATLPGRILVLCPPGEEHTFSPLLASYLLRRAGREAFFLGANVPLQRLEQALSNTRPNLVILIAQQLETAASALQMAGLLRENRIPMAFGGRVFNHLPEIRRRIPGHFISENIVEVSAVVEGLLNYPPALPEILSPSNEYQKAHISLREFLPQIEAAAWETRPGHEIPEEYFGMAIRFLSENILAALLLGEISLLDDQIAWIAGLIVNYGFSDEVLGRLLLIYAQVLENTLPKEDGFIAAHLMNSAHRLSSNRGRSL
jgi:DNA-binding transcriptional MerR regulator